MSDEYLTLRCPSCGVTSDRAPASLAGRKVRCAACHSTFLVPAAPPPAGADTPAPIAPTPIAPAEAVEALAEDFDDAAAAAAEPSPTIAESGPAPTIAEAEAFSVQARAEPPAPTVPEADLHEAAHPAAAHVWQAGDVVLGLYEVVEVLGEGGMGRVYRVHHRGWDLDLAVKVPLPAVLEDAGGADLFEREAETWVNLGLHPHVVTCHYVRRVEGLPLVFAEYANGGSLHEAIRTGRLDAVEAILDVAIQFAWGLHHAHEQGLVHRDVKPANVMLTRDGLAKVTDFGLARSRAVRLAAPGRGGAGHTMTVEGGGGATPAYVSPEQARGETLSRRSDIWSFGLSVLEMFAGRRSWDFGLKARDVLDSYRRGGLRGAGRPAMPEAVAELLDRCFRERADERPHDLAEVAAALRDSWEACTGTDYARREPRGGRGAADALNNRAASLVDLGRAAEAATLWRRALELDPHHVEATFNSALAAWTEARLADPELLRHVEEACVSHPAAARARQLQGRLHLMLGQPAEAVAALDRARALGSAEDLDQDRARARVPGPGPDQSLTRLAATITALAAAPGGRTVVAGCPKELRLFDAVSGQALRTIAVPEGSVRSLLVTPDDRFVVVGLEGAPTSVWELASGRHVRNFARQTGFATALAALPAGFVASGGSDRIVRLWDTTGRCVRELPGHEDAVSALAAGTSVLASAGRDGTVRLWSLADGRCLATLRGQGGRIHALALSEPQSRLVSAGDDGVVRDWGLRSHTLVRSYASHGQTVLALALSADGTRILSGSTDRTLRAFDTDGERLCRLTRLEGAIQGLTLCGDDLVWAAYGNRVSAVRLAPLAVPPLALCRPASAEDEETRTAFFEQRVGEARRSLDAGDFASAFRLAREARSVPGHERARAALTVWDELCARLPRQALLSAWEESRLEGHAEAVLAVALDSRSGRIATASLDGTVRSRNLVSTRDAELVLRGHDGAVTGVAFLPALGQILSAGRDRTLRLWDAGTGSAVAVLEGHAETIAAIDVSPDGMRAASASWDGSVRVWDLRGRTIAGVLEGHGANVAAVCFSADGQMVATGGWDGSARLWDLDSGKTLAVLSGHDGNVTAVALHPAARVVATGGADGAVRLFDPRAKRPPRVLAAHSAEVTALAFTSEGRFLLSASRDRSVRVWDARRGEAVRSLAHPAMVLGLALGPTASLLATACADRTTRLWHLDWEPEAAADATQPAAPATPARVVPSAPSPRAAAVVRNARTTVAAATRASTLREDLSRSASGPVRALRPRAARVARRLSWSWIGAGLALALVAVVSVLATRKAAPRLQLSPQMARHVPAALDLVDVAAFTGSCVAGEYDQHLERLQNGTPSAIDVACIAERGTARLVSDVLDGAPLSGRDALATLLLQRHAVSALVNLDSEAMPVLCDRLSDRREDVRAVAGLALGVAREGTAGDCLRNALLEGSPAATAAAVPGMQQRIARGLLPVEDAWRLVRELLEHQDPQSRSAGLALAPLFAAGVSGPAVRPLLSDRDPQLAEAARKAIASIEALRGADALYGGEVP